MSSDAEGAGARHESTGDKAEPLLAFADALLAEAGREHSDVPGDVRQFVTFILHDREYGIPILQCREIVRVSAITRVPEAPAHVRGVVNLRGHIVPAVDTRSCLGLGSVPTTARSRLIVVEVAGRQFALIVDRVKRILRVAMSAIEPVTEGAAPSGATGVARVGDGVIHLMDAARVLREGESAVGSNARGKEA